MDLLLCFPPFPPDLRSAPPPHEEGRGEALFFPSLFMGEGQQPKVARVGENKAG